jgi:hypothetical protein
LVQRQRARPRCVDARRDAHKHLLLSAGRLLLLLATARRRQRWQLTLLLLLAGLWQRQQRGRPHTVTACMRLVVVLCVPGAAAAISSSWTRWLSTPMSGQRQQEQPCLLLPLEVAAGGCFAPRLLLLHQAADGAQACQRLQRRMGVVVVGAAAAFTAVAAASGSSSSSITP